MNRLAVAALAAVTLSGARELRAQDNTLDTTFAVRGTPRLSVNNMSGRITVQGWNRPQVRLQAQYDRAQVVADVSPTRISIRSESRRGDNEVDYTINVPVGTPIELTGISPDIAVTGVCADLNVNVVSGDVNVTCAQGDVTIQSVSGDLDISDIRGGSLEASSTSGDVQLANIKGSVTANSVSGDIQMQNIESDEASAETVNGDIGYSGRIADNGRYRFEAHSGDITVRAPNAFNAQVSVSTFNGDFEPDFPITITPGPQRSREWQFSVGSGSARMSLRSFSGTIYLKRGAGAGSRNEEEDR